jgi:hypothetical protein
MSIRHHLKFKELDFYGLAWKEENEQWERLREWKKNVSPSTKIARRTHLMDFASGYNAALRAVEKYGIIRVQKNARSGCKA